MNKELVQEFINTLNSIRSHDTCTVYSDFMEMATCALQKPFEFVNGKDVDKKYKEIINQYTREEQFKIPHLLGIFIAIMEEEAQHKRFTDVAGYLFSELNLIDKKTGQFFTPQSVCDLTANVMPDKEIKKVIDEKGYITLDEPSCGAGAMILSFATRMAQLGYNPQQKLLVRATDIDRRCVNMTFVQLSYYALPGVVFHGNSLAQKTWDKLYTPFYILNGWMFKKK